MLKPEVGITSLVRDASEPVRNAVYTSSQQSNVRFHPSCPMPYILGPGYSIGQAWQCDTIKAGENPSKDLFILLHLTPMMPMLHGIALYRRNRAPCDFHVSPFFLMNISLLLCWTIFLLCTH